MSSSATPSDMVAVYDNARDQWWLYYIETDGQLNIIMGPKDGAVEDTETNPQYERAVPRIEATNIPSPRAGNSQLGVCEYVDNAGKPQTRVYYLDSRSRLVELGWNAERKWFNGALTSQKFVAASNSVITAAVTKEQLKVYYRGDDDDNGKPQLWVAWVTKGEEAWSRREVMTF